MITHDGHYILNMDDWNTIIKYFLLNPKTVALKEAPDLMFTEYQMYNIFSKKILFSFYNHDGKIRIPGDGKTIAYEIDISMILNKNPDPPAPQILKVVRNNSRAKTK